MIPCRGWWRRPFCRRLLHHSPAPTLPGALESRLRQKQYPRHCHPAQPALPPANNLTPPASPFSNRRFLRSEQPPRASPTYSRRPTYWAIGDRIVEAPDFSRVCRTPVFQERRAQSNRQPLQLKEASPRHSSATTLPPLTLCSFVIVRSNRIPLHARKRQRKGHSIWKKFVAFATVKYWRRHQCAAVG
jgi:hypothetical protein